MGALIVCDAGLLRLLSPALKVLCRQFLPLIGHSLISKKYLSLRKLLEILDVQDIYILFFCFCFCFCNFNLTFTFEINEGKLFALPKRLRVLAKTPASLERHKCRWYWGSICTEEYLLLCTFYLIHEACHIGVSHSVLMH